MKKIIFLIIIGSLQIGHLSGQYGPSIWELKVLPVNPTSIDSIYLLTVVGTPNLGYYLGYEVIENNSIIKVESCYYSGNFTDPEFYFDTINLGLKDIGHYDLKYIAYLTGDNAFCDRIDSSMMDLSFNVISPSSINENTEEFSMILQPNPIINDFFKLQSNRPLELLEIFDRYGNIILHKDIGGNNFIIVNMNSFSAGMYIVRAIDIQGYTMSRKVIKI